MYSLIILKNYPIYHTAASKYTVSYLDTLEITIGSFEINLWCYNFYCLWTTHLGWHVHVCNNYHSSCDMKYIVQQWMDNYTTLHCMRSRSDKLWKGERHRHNAVDWCRWELTASTQIINDFFSLDIIYVTQYHNVY